MIREQILKRRKHNPHQNIPFVTELATIKGLAIRHALYIMFVLYTEGGTGPKELAERTGVTRYHIAASITRLRRKGLVKTRFKDAYSNQKLYFINDKNAFLMSIMDSLSKKYGKVVIKGLNEYEEMMAHIDAYEMDLERPIKKVRTRCQKK